MALKTTIIASIDGMDVLANLTERKVLLAGEATFASLNQNIPQGFVPQPPREATSGLLSQFKKNAKKVYVALDQRLFDARKTRFALAFDGYLSWGFRQRSNVPIVLFGGGESSTGVNVEALIFHKSELVELREKALPQKESMYFQDSLTAMLAELRLAYPTARFIQAAPLTDWNVGDVEYIGDKPLRRLAYRPLSRNHDSRSSYVVPALLAALALFIYPAMAVSGWKAYTTAVAEYDAAMSDPAVNSKNGMDTDFLTTMNSRRIYMEQPRRQTTLAEKTSFIVTGIAAIPKLQIMEMKLPAPGSNPQDQVGLTINPEKTGQRAKIQLDRPADIWISIAAPTTGDAALVQAKDIMTQIANNTGMSMRLTHQGWRDEGPRRIFNIECFVHD